MPNEEDCDIYVVETNYIPQSANNKSTMLMSSYPAYRMQLVYISVPQDSRYNQTFDVSSVDLVDSSRKYIDYIDRGIDVIVGMGPTWGWVPKSIFGLSIGNILPTEYINSTGVASHSIFGTGAYTKKYVRFLDTENKYSGSYITGAVANKVIITSRHSTMYYDTSLGRNTSLSKEIVNNASHPKYDSEIYDIAWNNYRYYGSMGYYMLGNVVFKTEDGALTKLNQQTWDSWDSYYDQN